MKEQNYYRREFLPAIFLVFLVGVHALAQDCPQTARLTNNENGIVDNTYLITVTVNLGHQRGAVDLVRDNFALSDNGIRQDIPFFARIQPDSGNNDVIYALGYGPQSWLFDGERRKVRVVIRDATGKELKAHFSPTEYPGTRPLLDGP